MLVENVSFFFFVTDEETIREKERESFVKLSPKDCFNRIVYYTNDLMTRIIF